ncbi:MAG: SMP-30/gluconolactonase/LRE family protein [Thermomicrobiales bacterium]
MRIAVDNGLTDLLNTNEEKRESTGYQFTEGPLWVPEHGCLLFTDIPANTIYRWEPGGDAEVFRRPSNHANGLTLDNEGRLLACEHSGRRISIAEFGKDPEPLAEMYEEKRFNSPNDIVVASTDAIYFTDPDYGLLSQGEGEDAREMDDMATYRIATNGAVQRVATNFDKPNGLTFSPVETQMYIADSGARRINRYTVFADGALSSEGELFVDMNSDMRPGVPDGMKVDSDGRLWTTGPGGIWVLDADGEIVGQIELDEQPSNLAWGGPDFSTLYVTARTGLYSIETVVRGEAPGSR